MATTADCLPRICEARCDNEQFGHSDGAFRLNTNRSYRIARLYVDKLYVALKFLELRYVSYMFHVVHNQLNSYIAALPDVMTFAIYAFSSYTHDETAANDSNLIL